jgi:release factor glutamine methyltransferase
MKSVLEILGMSADYLQQRGVKSSRKEAADLIAWGLKVKPLDLYMQFDRPLDESELGVCRSLLKRRSQGEPYQYICGEVEFFNTCIEVNRNVLIPRQETEILVEMIAKDIALASDDNSEKAQASSSTSPKVLWDLCCGSGCIGIALKKAAPALRVVLSDISEEALLVAERNAKRNECHVEFVCGDFTSPCMDQQIDYLVCNPPYVSEDEYDQLEIEVRNFEPKSALVAKNRGLEFYARLAQAAPTFMQPGGKIWLEIGHTQGSAVREIFTPISKNIRLLQDWSGLDRFFLLEME